MRLKILIFSFMQWLPGASAWLLLFNGAAGLLVPLVPTLMHSGALDPSRLLAITPFWGIAAGVLALRGHVGGFLAGVGFYAIQVISFFSPDFNVSFKSGLSLAAVFVMPQGVMVVNWAALVLGLVCAVVVWTTLHRPSIKVEDRTTDL